MTTYVPQKGDFITVTFDPQSGHEQRGRWPSNSGKFYIIEHVPARVCQETGEQFFSPQTVERIQALIKGGKNPDRVVETPVYEYA